MRSDFSIAGFAAKRGGFDCLSWEEDILAERPHNAKRGPTLTNTLISQKDVNSEGGRHEHYHTHAMVGGVHMWAYTQGLYCGVPPPPDFAQPLHRSTVSFIKGIDSINNIDSINSIMLPKRA